jgi:hypothetical protein
MVVEDSATPPLMARAYGHAAADVMKLYVHHICFFHPFQLSEECCFRSLILSISCISHHTWIRMSPVSSG